jgi:hypothetical protein
LKKATEVWDNRRDMLANNETCTNTMKSAPIDYTNITEVIIITDNYTTVLHSKNHFISLLQKPK